MSEGHYDVRRVKKPYSFVSLPGRLPTAKPVWHDGTCSQGRLSGEIRLEMKNLTPLLVGWERGVAGGGGEWPAGAQPAAGPEVDDLLRRAAYQMYPDPRDEKGRAQVEAERNRYIQSKREAGIVWFPGAEYTVVTKPILCSLRAPWGPGPVIIPGDSLKGFLRHELGALLGAPMERVAERSYSYRPNLTFPTTEPGRRLEPRLARVVAQAHTTVDGETFPVPERVDILALAQKHQQTYYPRRENGQWVPAPGDAAPYRGGLGGGRKLSKPLAQRQIIHTHLDVHGVGVEHQNVAVPKEVITQYQRTLSHLLSPEHGHFSHRHPGVGSDRNVQVEAIRAVRQAALGAFQVGDLIWVEWDKKRRQVVSFGWHYYYRWAYQDTVRRQGWEAERPELSPLPEEREHDEDGAPRALSPIRRLLGYVAAGDNPGTQGIGSGNHDQLMGRVSVNAALEEVGEGERESDRFLPPVFLKELGMPRPSAVEFYLQQPHAPGQRPSDRASLVTYGDAAGYDQPGRLAGRKFYLDRPDAYADQPWQDDSPANRLNDRSTLAICASRPGRRFRFTVRFRDLDPHEVAWILLALCPDQFARAVGGTAARGYCSKLGYARPLGWGSVRIVARGLYLLNWTGERPELVEVPDLEQWFCQHFKPTPCLTAWLDVHRHQHPQAGPYPTKNGHIYRFHTELRGEHARLRRYERDDRAR